MRKIIIIILMMVLGIHAEVQASSQLSIGQDKKMRGFNLCELPSQLAVLWQEEVGACIVTGCLIFTVSQIRLHYSTFSTAIPGEQPESYWVSCFEYREYDGEYYDQSGNRKWYYNKINFTYDDDEENCDDGDNDGDTYLFCQDCDDNDPEVWQFNADGTGCLVTDIDGDGIDDVVDPLPNNPNNENYYVSKTAYDENGELIYSEIWVSNEYGEIIDIIEYGDATAYNEILNGLAEGTTNQITPYENPFTSEYFETYDLDGLNTFLSTAKDGSEMELGLGKNPDSTTSDTSITSDAPTTNDPGSSSGSATGSSDPGTTTTTDNLDYSNQFSSMIANQNAIITNQKDYSNQFGAIISNQISQINLLKSDVELGKKLVTLQSKSNSELEGIGDALTEKDNSYNDEVNLDNLPDEESLTDEYDYLITELGNLPVVSAFQNVGFNFSGVTSTYTFTLPETFDSKTITFDYAIFEDEWDILGNILFVCTVISGLFYLFRG